MYTFVDDSHEESLSTHLIITVEISKAGYGAQWNLRLESRYHDIYTHNVLVYTLKGIMVSSILLKHC